MRQDDGYGERLRGRAWFIPGRDALRIEDPKVFTDDLRAPLSGRGTTFSWYRPGELLVRVDAADEVRRFLQDNGADRWRPGATDHWRDAGRRTVDERLTAALAELAGVELWTLPLDADLPALVARTDRGRGDGPVALNQVLFGEPKYMGGPGGMPTPAAAPKLRQTAGAGESPAPDLAVLDTGLPVDWTAAGATYRLRGFIAAADLAGTAEWDLLDANADRSLDRQAAHGLFICGLANRHAPELRIDPGQVLHSDGTGDVAEIVRGLWEVTAPVVNLSLGCYTDDNRPPRYLSRALRALHDRGTVFVAAAGNNGRDPAYRGRRFWPAAMREVIGVGAYDSRAGVVADFSNRGSWIDVWAPGVDLVSDYVPGWAVPSADWVDPSEPPVDLAWGTDTSTEFVHWSGTSFAAPLVAAEIARRVRRDPAADPQTVAEDFLTGLPYDPVIGRLFDPGDYTV